MQKFQEEFEKTSKDPYKLIIKPTNLPTTILNESAKVIFFKGLEYLLPIMFYK